MRFIAESSIRGGWFTHSFQPPQLAGVFVAKLTCRLQPNGTAQLIDDAGVETVAEADAAALAANSAATEPRLEPAHLQGDVHADDDPAAPLLASTDFAPFKPRCDMLLRATSYSPSRRPEVAWVARWHVGEWSKSLRIVGDRQWLVEPLGFRTSAPQPTQQVPLDYRCAFGGPSSPLNPTGRGYGWQAVQLPNIEDPTRPIRTPSDDCPPAGVGPLASHWSQRRQHVGTYDELWRATRWPWFPQDFDYAYFNAAPADQQLAIDLLGDEELAFENLDAELPFLRTRLPGVRVRCFISETVAEPHQLSANDFREVTLRFDTLHIDLHTRTATLLFRGHAPVRTLKMSELQTVFMMTESVAAPVLSPAAWLQHFHNLAHDEPEEVTDAAEQAAETAELAAFQAKMDALEAEHAQVTQQAEQQAAAAFQQAVAAGIDPAQLNAAAVGSLSELQAQMREMAQAIRATQPQSARELEEQAAELEQLATVEAEMQAGSEEPLTREDVQRMAAAGASFHGLSLVDLELHELNLAGLDFSDVDFSECMLDGVDLSGANLQNANFSGADLTDANLRGACLDYADFSEAVVEGCNFENASLRQANLSELELVGLNFRGIHAAEADFSQSQLSGADFTGAQLARADFSGAQLAAASFERAQLPAASFEGAQARGARLAQADLSGVHASEQADFSGADLRNCVADGSIWDSSILDACDCRQSSWQHAIFSSASLVRCRLDRSNLANSVLDDANLNHASLDQCNLLRASLERADLRGASLREANIYLAGFWDAQLAGLDRRGTKLLGTILRDE